MRARQAGFSLLELLVVIVLISVLLSVAIDRLTVIRAKAERAAMEQVLGSIRSGIQIRVAELIAGNRMAELATLPGTNPMQRLAERPPNYLGELFGPDPTALEPGNWYFDTRARALVYLVDSDAFFDSALAGAPRALFAIEPVFDDVNRNGRYDPAVDTMRGLRLGNRSRYAWRDNAAWPDWNTMRAKAQGGWGP